MKQIVNGQPVKTHGFRVSGYRKVTVNSYKVSLDFRGRGFEVCVNTSDDTSMVIWPVGVAPSNAQISKLHKLGRDIVAAMLNNRETGKETE